MKSAGIFLSSRTPTFEINSDLEIFAEFLAKANIKLIYGGGKCGLMGKISEAVSKSKGKIKGITLPMFNDIGVTPSYLDELEIEENFYLRKKSLIDQSDFIVIMPGGVGTADEFFDAFNHLSLGLISKSIYIYNKNDCWTDLLKWIEKNIELNMLSKMPDSVYVSHSIDELIETIQANEV
ncbi:MAG: hypothetical protein CMQ57_01915 [Gammaproteobacteria bacterium]|nr:hypothetical protein [Gammaproteobacteria bacterium]